MSDPFDTVREALLEASYRRNRAQAVASTERGLAALDRIQARVEELENDRLREIIRDWLPDMDGDMQQAFRAALSEEEE